MYLHKHWVLHFHRCFFVTVHFYLIKYSHTCVYLSGLYVVHEGVYPTSGGLQIVPLLVGVAAVAVTTAVLAKIFLFGRKKAPVTLKDPSIKYPLKLVDKEVCCLCPCRASGWIDLKLNLSTCLCIKFGMST